MPYLNLRDTGTLLAGERVFAVDGVVPSVFSAKVGDGYANVETGSVSGLVPHATASHFTHVSTRRATYLVSSSEKRIRGLLGKAAG